MEFILLITWTTILNHWKKLSELIYEKNSHSWATLINMCKDILTNIGNDFWYSLFLKVILTMYVISYNSILIFHSTLNINISES